MTAPRLRWRVTLAALLAAGCALFALWDVPYITTTTSHRTPRGCHSHYSAALRAPLPCGEWVVTVPLH